MVRHAPEFQAAADFQEGLARVYVWDKIVCTTAQEYNKDNAPEYLFRLPGWGGNESCFPQEARFGFIDKTGSLIVPARFTWLEDLSEGLAVAKVDAGAKFGYIDRTGTFVISPRFNQAKSFSEGLAGVEASSRIEDHRLVDVQRGYIDKSGRVVIPAVYQYVGQFSEGLAGVGVVIGRQMGYVNHDGKMVIAPRFIEALDFSEGMAAACDRNGCSYINRDGDVALRVKGALWPFQMALPSYQLLDPDSVTSILEAGQSQNTIDLPVSRLKSMQERKPEPVTLLFT